MKQHSFFTYQLEGGHWLARTRFAILADEMGLGKSAQAILAADELDLKRILIICPAIARVNWQREVERWSSKPHTFRILEKINDETGLGREDVVICSFEYATANGDKFFRGMQWDVVVIDEMHFVKSIDAKRAKKILGYSGIVHRSKRVWALSGTPAPNHAGEMWIILYVFGATKLKYEEFIDKFCDTLVTGYGVKVVGTKKSAIPELRALLSPSIFLRRKKCDVLKDLPPIILSDFFVEPGIVDEKCVAVQSMINYVSPEKKDVRELKARIAKEREALKSALELSRENMAMLEGMASSVSTLMRYTGLQKIAPTVELISGELDAKLYKKIVLFAVHKDVVKGLMKGLARFNPVAVYGEVDAKTRQENVDRFRSDPACQIFIGNIRAAGTNLTLIEAAHVTFIERDWVPGNNAQALMRVHRIGQKNNVSGRFISLNNPMEQKLSRVLNKKTFELAEIFDAKEAFHAN